jgi:hypothetical protein
MINDYQIAIFGKDCLVQFKKEPDIDSIQEVRRILNELTDQLIEEKFYGRIN